MTTTPVRLLNLLSFDNAHCESCFGVPDVAQPGTPTTLEIWNSKTLSSECRLQTSMQLTGWRAEGWEESGRKTGRKPPYRHGSTAGSGSKCAEVSHSDATQAGKSDGYTSGRNMFYVPQKNSSAVGTGPNSSRVSALFVTTYALVGGCGFVGLEHGRRRCRWDPKRDDVLLPRSWRDREEARGSQGPPRRAGPATR